MCFQLTEQLDPQNNQLSRLDRKLIILSHLPGCFCLHLICIWPDKVQAQESLRDIKPYENIFQPILYPRYYIFYLSSRPTHFSQAPMNGRN